MLNFLICGIIFLLYAYIRFKKKVFYPSVIFCVMWGINCIYHWLIFLGYINPLVKVEEYDYQYMNTYIVYFTLASIIGFSLAELKYGCKRIHLSFSPHFLFQLLKAYNWIMWANFFGGILRIIVMIQLVGFDFSNVIDYRMAANNMMMGLGGGFASIVFRLTAYIIMLANFYVALSGLKAGLTRMDSKDVMRLFLLYMPSQMATGGRLFILYYIIFYFGCFLLGRGIAINESGIKWLSKKEQRAIMKMIFIMAPLVVIITAVRGQGGIQNLSSENRISTLDALSYITDGTMTTDNCMRYFGMEDMDLEYGKTTFLGKSDKFLQFQSYKHTTIFASSVISIILPLYVDFGYWGSLIAWIFMAFFMESLALRSLRYLTISRFLVYAMLLKICYESIMSNPIAGNIPMFELLILFALFYKSIFGKLEKRYS